MRKGFYLILGLTFIASIASVNIANAQDEKERYVYPPTTEWCKNHPEECTEYKTKDEWVDKQVRDCVDAMGNRNGKAEQWEIEKFADECR